MGIELFDTYAAFDEASLAVLARAEREIRCFDVDLSRSALASARAVGALQAFLGAGAKHRLDLLLHDAGHLVRDCPRLLGLYQQRSHQISIKVISTQHRDELQPFVSADARHVATRFHNDHARGKLVIDDPAECAWFTAQFETLNGAANTATGIAILGI